MVAVRVVGGVAAELAAGQFAGLAVVVGGLLPGGGAGERPEFQQRARYQQVGGPTPKTGGRQLDGRTRDQVPAVAGSTR